jgi:hypothetical protein
MPKTGSSSIQDSLFLGLSDPRFRYIHLTGHSNAALFLEALFKEDPSQYWVYQQKGLGPDRVQLLKDSYDHKLRQTLRRATKAKATAILSAERCWNYKDIELETLRRYFDKENVRVRIVIYLRPIKSWVESAFQQNVKHFQGFTELGTLGDEFAQTKLNYAERLEMFAQIFGRENLIIRPFTSRSLKLGCAVQDFCSTLGIHMADRSIQRTNDAVCADAVRMLYCFHRFSPSAKAPSLRRTDLLVMRLSELEGERFRLHSDLLAPLRDHIERQNSTILQEYGVDLREDLHAHDGVDCIRQESDLLRFSRSSLDWLNRLSSGLPIVETEGIATAHAVAQKIAILVKKPSKKVLSAWLRRNLRLKLHGMVHGS